MPGESPRHRSVMPGVVGSRSGANILTNFRAVTRGGVIAVVAIALATAGCLGGGGSGGGSDGGNSGGGGGNPPPPVNRAPTISGTPPTSLVAGTSYDFAPTASDPDGDALTFSIRNRPVWASFSNTTGRLSGTPAAADVGQFANVVIEVSDGRAAAELGAFTITVNQIALGSVTLSWTPPTTNADGSTITDLAGYRIYYGRSTGALDQTIIIDNPGIIRWVVDNLAPTTWYFAMTSFNSTNVESARTGVVSRAVS